MEVEEQKGELNQRRLEEAGTHGEFLLGMLTSRRKRSVSSSLTKRRMTAKAKADLEQEEQELLELENEIKELEKEKTEAVAAAKEKWSEWVSDVQEIPLTPTRRIFSLSSLAWYGCPIIYLESERTCRSSSLQIIFVSINELQKSTCFEGAFLLLVHFLTPGQCPEQGVLVGVFQVAANRKPPGEAGYARTKRDQLLAQVKRGCVTFHTGIGSNNDFLDLVLFHAF
jgi:hypothetical protein